MLLVLVELAEKTRPLSVSYVTRRSVVTVVEVLSLIVLYVYTVTSPPFAAEVMVN